MLMEVGDFCQRVESDLSSLIDDLQKITGMYGPENRKAWETSLPKVSVILARPELADFHLHLGESGGVSLEYRLPASSSWCDTVLLGRGNDTPQALIIELKEWDTSSDTPGPTESLIIHKGTEYLHPADQVRGYVEYCRKFHAVVQEEQASVDGCVLLLHAKEASAHSQPPHDHLVNQFPVFTRTEDDITRFVKYASSRLKKPDIGFAKRFEAGTYKQDRRFVEQIAQQILNPLSRPFELLGNQRFGFELCRLKLHEMVKQNEAQKQVIIIEGPPGSGKSVLASMLWATAVSSEGLPRGNVVLTTTSASQGSNWEYIYKLVAKTSAGSGVVIRANKYAPATTQWFGQYNEDNPDKKMSADEWVENLKVLHKQQGHFRCGDDCFMVSIVDEAHALINPEVPAARPGVHGWPIAAGPQAYHIIRSSRITVFLMDSAQSFRDNETTKKDDIIRHAKMLGAEVAEPISLADNQFRCGGSKEYVEWIEHVLGMRKEAPKDKWRRSSTHPTGPMIFEVFDSPREMEDALREKMRTEKATVRLVAPFSRPWVTQRLPNPHDLPPAQKDFYVQSKDGAWSKIWNYAPGADPDYSLFIQAPPRSKMNDDPLCEVGCPYTVRGFDYDYLGVIWGKDLIRRGDRWQFDLDHVHERAWKQTLAAVKREIKAKAKERPGAAELLRRLQIAYRILLTRAVRGIHVWFEDQETREYVVKMLGR